MATISVTIPAAQVQLVLDAFASRRGIPATQAAVKAEIINEIKQVVKRYKLQRLETGMESTLSKADLEVGVT